ncbi:MULTISPECIES: hypothetical protein [Actinomyces]|uniref:ABC transporter permease n=2 Tax=Actinomyces TaxID=1654 RepID=A0A7T0LKP3_9ACTO|nr:MULTISPECIES: hypothetical protein [Actinomyces]QPL05527.1 hypothetical protein ID810_00560 [Actinomyces respiraculi]
MSGMIAAIRSEWTKTFTLPSVWIITGALFAVFLLFQFLSFEFYSETAARLTSGESTQAQAVALLQGDLMASIFNPGILFTLLGAVIAGAEFRTGQFGMSVVAVPNRIRLVVSKVLVAALFALALGVIWYAIGTSLMLASTNGVAAAAVLNGDFFATLGRVLLFMVAFALFPLGLTLLTRRTLTGVIAAMVFFMLTLTQVVAMVSPAVDAFLPLSAARNLLLNSDDTPVPTTAGPVHGALVLTAWAVLTVVLAAVVTKRRDAS